MQTSISVVYNIYVVQYTDRPCIQPTIYNICRLTYMIYVYSHYLYDARLRSIIYVCIYNICVYIDCPISYSPHYWTDSIGIVVCSVQSNTTLRIYYSQYIVCMQYVVRSQILHLVYTTLSIYWHIQTLRSVQYLYIY